ncbi:hypothetical protein K439DRAFT_1622183 [Ramaria rubella]|nr:hypothetical protein K439DRAFT_1622183 [Ramaria rubella]
MLNRGCNVQAAQDIKGLYKRIPPCFNPCATRSTFYSPEYGILLWMTHLAVLSHLQITTEITRSVSLSFTKASALHVLVECLQLSDHFESSVVRAGGGGQLVRADAGPDEDDGQLGRGGGQRVRQGIVRGGDEGGLERRETGGETYQRGGGGQRAPGGTAGENSRTTARS